MVDVSGRPAASQLKGITASTLESHSIKKGILTKRGIKRKNWKKRYFILHENYLYYFKSQKALQPQGRITLHHSSEVSDQIPAKNKINKKNCFMITTPTRDFFIFADSAQDTSDWMQAIKEKINELKKKNVTKNYSKNDKDGENNDNNESNNNHNNNNKKEDTDSDDSDEKK